MDYILFVCNVYHRLLTELFPYVYYAEGMSATVSLAVGSTTSTA